jgi:hypothetical protein
MGFDPGFCTFLLRWSGHADSFLHEVVAENSCHDPPSRQGDSAFSYASPIRHFLQTRSVPRVAEAEEGDGELILDGHLAIPRVVGEDSIIRDSINESVKGMRGYP